jgi:hypothetical protein
LNVLLSFAQFEREVSVAVCRAETLKPLGSTKPVESRFSLPEASNMAGVRILLTDKTIAQLLAPDGGWHLARDTELKGFFFVVGKRKRTFSELALLENPVRREFHLFM